MPKRNVSWEISQRVHSTKSPLTEARTAEPWCAGYLKPSAVYFEQTPLSFLNWIGSAIVFPPVQGADCAIQSAPVIACAGRQRSLTAAPGSGWITDSAETIVLQGSLGSWRGNLCSNSLFLVLHGAAFGSQQSWVPGSAGFQALCHQAAGRTNLVFIPHFPLNVLLAHL